jgi:hypothetical protein
MEVAQFCSTSHVVIVAGKGGVGKTTVTAALAVAAVRAGSSVLVVEVEGKSGLATMFDTPSLSYDEVDLDPGIRARFLTPDAALVDYLETHGMKRISKRLISSGALEVVANAVPGMKDILVLGKVKSLDESRGRPDHRRRTGGRPRDLVPALAAACSTQAGGADQQAGVRRGGAADRSRSLSGDVGDVAGRDAGQRAHRDRMRSRTAGRRASGR